MKKTILTVLLSFLVLSSVSKAEIDLPDGWRYPTKEETTDGLIKWRHEHPNRFLFIRDDFNGDGVLDESKLLVNDEKDKMALFVFLSKGKQYEQIILVEQDKVWISSMGIQVASPGKYQTVCGKGYFKCEPGLPDFLTLENPAIDFFEYASADVYFYWNETSGKFDNMQMSD